MQLAKHIKQKPRYFKFIPGLNTNVANTIYPFIFLPKEVYQGLLSDSVDPRYAALLVHEEHHYKKQKEMGLLVFGIKYLFSEHFRDNEEIAAVKEALKYLKNRNQPLIFADDSLTNPHNLFLYPVSKRHSLETIKVWWDEVV